MIRPARIDDEPAIRAITQTAYARYVPRMGRRPAPMDADFAHSIAAGYAHVAVDGAGVVLGYAVCWARGDHLYLDSIAVGAPGLGVGRALMDHVEGLARAQGLGAVQLYTNAMMTENLGLYPRWGFTQTDRRMDEGYDRVFFEKRLMPRG